MREIMFRGVTHDFSSPVWVYGDLICNSTDAPRIMDDYHDCYEPTTWIVDPDTVGQFTGLKDITDIQIFEGDIVEFWHEWHGINGEYCSKKMRGVVAYDGASFDVITRDERGDESFWELYTLWQSGSVQVIGNVYDNPRFLKEDGGDVQKSKS